MVLVLVPYYYNSAYTHTRILKHAQLHHHRQVGLVMLWPDNNTTVFRFLEIYQATFIVFFLTLCDGLHHGRPKRVNTHKLQNRLSPKILYKNVQWIKKMYEILIQNLIFFKKKNHSPKGETKLGPPG